MEEKIIGGESSSKSYIPGEGEAKSASAPVPLTDVRSAIIASTQQGGLTALPAGFDANDGYWKSIRSDNPFEVLFLDYKQYLNITTETVKNNYDILSVFWSEKSKLLTGGSREKIKKRYGEDTATIANKKLDACYNKLKTKEGINVYFKELDGKRYANAIKAIVEYADFALDDGELTKQEGLRIIKKGIENELNEVEVRNYLYQELMVRNFKPRSLTAHPDFIDNEWLTDEAFEIRRKRVIPDVFVLGKKISSLKEIGQILFINTEKAKTEYLHNAIYLPQDITKLETSGKALEFEKIINNESDINKRYFKIVYHLNPALPFVIDNESFETINHLFDKTAYNYALFLKAFNNYQQGFIHIWLTECDPVNAARLTPDFDYNDFLKFVYQINKKHPFYINEERFDNPQQLIEKAKKEKFYWSKISAVILSGQLPVWFAGIGKHEWIAQYNKQTEAFIDVAYYSEDDKKSAAVQTLIQIIDPHEAHPKIIAQPKSVQLLSLEGSHTMVQLVTLKLENQGFLKSEILLDKVIEGIWLNAHEATFQSQSGNTETKIILNIDALKLIKDKVYLINILVRTACDTLTVPVEIKVIFPKKAYYTQLIKYAVIGAIFFGGIRFLTGEITGTTSWFRNEYDPSAYNYFAYFIALVLLIGGLVSSYFIIKKVEKL